MLITLVSACPAKHDASHQLDAAAQPGQEPRCALRGGCEADAAPFPDLLDAGHTPRDARAGGDADSLPLDVTSGLPEATLTDAAPDVITLPSTCLGAAIEAGPEAPSCMVPPLGTNLIVERVSDCDPAARVGNLDCAPVASSYFDLAYPGDGSVLVLGASPGSVDLGCGELPEGTRSFVARFAADGACQWSTPLVIWKRFGSVPMATYFALSPQGELVVTGRYSGPVEIGGSAFPDEDPLKNRAFLVRMNLAGKVSSVQRIAADASVPGSLHPAFDARGRLYLAGNASTQVGFSPSCITPMPAFHNAWLAQVDAEGQPIWVRSFSGHELGSLVAVDDELLLAGRDGGDLFVRSFAQTTGADRWQTRFQISPGVGNTWLRSLAVSPDRIAIGGALAQSITVGVSTLQGHYGAGEAFIAMLNRTGTPLHGRLFPLHPDAGEMSFPQSHLVALAFASDGALLATGAFSASGGATTSFGGRPLHTFQSAGPTGFAALFDERLEHLASARFSGYPASVLLSCDGAAYLGTAQGALRLR